MTASLGNHRRIEIIRLLRKQPLQCVDEIAAACKIDKSTASEHLRRLHEGGMIGKKYRGRFVGCFGKLTVGQFANCPTVPRRGIRAGLRPGMRLGCGAGRRF